ncbi:MAG: alpha/beta hydrolase [Bacteroidota bacterium]
MLLYWIVGIPIAYALLYFLVPRGNLLQEVLSLPIYLLKVLRVPTDNMLIEKHRFGPHRRQYFLLCKPKDGQIRKKQVILFHHGGGWGSGSPELFRINAKQFVERGHWVILPTYRQIPFYGYEAIREDISLGLKKGVEILREQGMEDFRIVLGGMSAGGNLVALLLYDRQRLAQLGFDQQLFSGIMLFGAPLDLKTMYWTPPLWLFAGSKGSPQFQQASPINYLQEDEQTPVLCYHGTRDGMVAIAGSYNFIQKLPPAIVTFYPIEGASHLDLGSWNFGNEEMLKEIFRFLEKVETQRR